MGARLRCACATICTICASTVSRPTLSARMTKPPDWFMVPPMTLSPTLLVTGMDSPVTIEFVDGTAPFEDLAVDGHALSGPHAQAVADDHLIEAHILVRAVRPDAAGHLRGEIEQRADGAAGLLAGLAAPEPVRAARAR